MSLKKFGKKLPIFLFAGATFFYSGKSDGRDFDFDLPISIYSHGCPLGYTEFECSNLMENESNRVLGKVKGFLAIKGLEYLLKKTDNDFVIESIKTGVDYVDDFRTFDTFGVGETKIDGLKLTFNNFSDKNLKFSIGQRSNSFNYYLDGKKEKQYFISINYKF